ncbi:Uncharacterised protein [Mycobacteroides abscessus subsp. abscessus]|nr:Uncharacterised protein [Mycobacteroides abscessus subsp. abscessus]
MAGGNFAGPKTPNQPYTVTSLTPASNVVGMFSPNPVSR